MTTKDQELGFQGPSIESLYLGPQEVETYHFIILCPRGKLCA